MDRICMEKARCKTYAKKYWWWLVLRMLSQWRPCSEQLTYREGDLNSIQKIWNSTFLNFGNSTRTWMFAFGSNLFRSRLCRSLCQSDFKSYSVFVRSRVAFQTWRGICDSLVHWWRCTDGLLHMLLSFLSFWGCCDRPSKSTTHGVGSAAIHS